MYRRSACSWNRSGKAKKLAAAEWERREEVRKGKKEKQQSLSGRRGIGKWERAALQGRALRRRMRIYPLRLAGLVESFASPLAEPDAIPLT
eukprot:767555-Hanusia_phi.AAC.4